MNVQEKEKAIEIEEALEADQIEDLEIDLQIEIQEAEEDRLTVLNEGQTPSRLDGFLPEIRLLGTLSKRKAAKPQRATCLECGRFVAATFTQNRS